MHCGNAAQFRIDLRNKRPELQLFCELARVEIPNRTRLNFAGVDLGVINGFFTGLDNEVPDRFTFLLHVALKICAPAAENVNRLTHSLA
jgi:hypothetical protein